MIVANTAAVLPYLASKISGTVTFPKFRILLVIKYINAKTQQRVEAAPIRVLPPIPCANSTLDIAIANWNYPQLPIPQKGLKQLAGKQLYRSNALKIIGY